MAGVQLPPALRSLREEFARNQRLRWGAWAILGLGALYFLVVLVDWRRDLHERYQQRTTELYKVAQLAGQEQWIVRAQEARRLRNSLQAEIPKANSIGLAQAEVQSTVRQITRAFGQSLNATSPAPAPVSGRTDLWRVPVTLNGTIEPRLLLEVLRRVEGNPRLMTIEQLSYRTQQGRPQLSMTVVAFYRIDAAQGGDAGAD